MKKILTTTLLIISTITASSLYADSLTSKFFQAATEQAKNVAIDKASETALDTAKQKVEKAFYSKTISGIAVKVLDGDTIDVKTQEGIFRIRFDSIDAPEKSQPFGQVSKQTLSRWIGNQQVTVDVITKDRYGRLIGVVYLETANINKALVEKGLAFANVSYLNDKSIAEVEKTAKARRVGVWQIPEDKIVKPWDYRHQGRN